MITTLFVALAVGCARQQSCETRLTKAERDVLQNYHTSPAMVERAARLCLIRQLTKADVLTNTSDTMRREVRDDSITFYFAPSQWWTLTFDADGKALAADITGKKITRKEAEEGPNNALKHASQGEAESQWVTPAIRAPRLQRRTFDSAAAKSKVSYHIYTPEQYDREKERRFPVLYWLHGTGGGMEGVRYLAAHFDGAIRAGKTPPLLVVFANGLNASMWCDSKDGRVPMETVVVKELVPHVDATFRTIASREGRLIEGFSMGGYGAARLGFKYHDIFGAVSILAGGPLDREFAGPRAIATPAERARILQTVYGGDIDYFKAQSPWVLAEQNAAAVRGNTRVRQVIGDRDPTLSLNRVFDAHLTRLGIPHGFTVLPAVAHDPRAVLDALGEGNWEFYRAVFGAKGAPDDRRDQSNAQPADAAGRPLSGR